MQKWSTFRQLFMQHANIPQGNSRMLQAIATHPTLCYSLVITIALQEGHTIFLEKSMLLASWGRTARYCSGEKTTVPEF